MINAAFAVGAKVRVKAFYPPGHVRTPYYCRGKLGTIERVLGPYHNPEQLAYGDPDPDALVLYRVRFSQHELWDNYPGGTADGLELELYEPWLEPA